MLERSETIRLFGQSLLKARNDGNAAPAKAYCLLAALSFEPRYRMTRTRIASLLWEDVAQATALANLRQLLVRLRTRLGEPELVETTKSDVALSDAGQRSDLVRFLSAYDRITRLPQQERDIDFATLAIFAGDLIAGFDPDGHELQAWLRDRRTQLNEFFYTLSELYLRRTTRFGHCDALQLETVGMRLLGIFPEDDVVKRIVLEAFARSGSPRLVERASRLSGRRPAQALAADRGSKSSADIDRRPRVAFLPAASPVRYPLEWLLTSFLDDVANTLTRFRSVLVISSQSTLGRKNVEKVGVECEFSVQSYVLPHNGDLVVRLLDEDSGEIVWSAEYVLNPDALDQTFRFLSKHVAATLANEVERAYAEGRRIEGNGVSYRLFLQGNSLMAQSTLPNLRRARKVYLECRNRSGGLWSEPVSRLAQTSLLEWLLLGREDSELIGRADYLAQQAVDLDPFDPTAHWMHANVALYQRQYELSNERFLEAEILAPNNAELLVERADALSHLGEVEAAWHLFERACELNPLGPDRHWWSGASIAFARGDYEGCVALIGRMRDDESALRVLTASLAHAGRLSAARHSAARLREVYPGLTVSEIVALVPNKHKEVTELLKEGLVIAGL